MPQFLDLTGQLFGRLTVLRRTVVRLGVAILALAAAAVPVSAQTRVVSGNELTIGAAPARPDGSSVRLQGLLGSGGTRVVILDAEGDAAARLLLRSDLPSEIAYEDEANVFQAGLTQTFQGLVSVQGGLTNAAGFDIDIGAGGGVARRFIWPDTAVVAEPSVNVRSVGTRAVWHDSVASDQADYATGVAGGTLWESVPNPAGRFRWYGGDTHVGQLSGFGTLELDKDLLPLEPYSGFIGYPNRKWLSLWVAELNAETLVAREVMATIGGRIITAPTTSLLRPALAGDTELVVAQNNTTIGEYLLMEGQFAFEALRATGTPTLLNRVLSPAFEGGISGWSANMDQTVDQQCDVMSGVDPTLPIYVQGRCVLRWIYGGTSLPRVFANTATLSGSTAYRLCAAVRAGDPSSPTVITEADILIAIGTNTVTTPPDLVRQRDDQPEWYDVCATITTPSSPIDQVRFAPDETVAGQWRFDAVSLYETAFGPLPWTANGAVVPVTRDLDGTGANVWPAGSAVLNTGTCGDGFIDQYAISGLHSASAFGPTIVGNVRTDCMEAGDFNAWSERWAVGNLEGLYDYGGETYGFAAGDEASDWISADASNGVRMFSGGSNLRMQLDAGLLNFYGSTGILRSQLSTNNLAMFDNAGDVRVLLSGDNGRLFLGGDSLGDPSSIALLPDVSNLRIYDAAGDEQVRFDSSGNLHLGGVQESSNSGARIDILGSSGDLRLRMNGENKITMSASTGDVSLDGNVRGGSATALNTGVGYFLGSTGTFRAGDPAGDFFRWDGTNLDIIADRLTLQGQFTFGNIGTENVTADVVNWDPPAVDTSTLVLITPDDDYEIAGLAPQPSGTRVRFMIHPLASPFARVLRFNHEDTNATDTWRIRSHRGEAFCIGLSGLADALFVDMVYISVRWFIVTPNSQSPASCTVASDP